MSIVTLYGNQRGFRILFMPYNIGRREREDVILYVMLYFVVLLY